VPRYGSRAAAVFVAIEPSSIPAKNLRQMDEHRAAEAQFSDNGSAQWLKSTISRRGWANIGPGIARVLAAFQTTGADACGRQ